MAIEKDDVKRRVGDAIRKTINKFREHPYYFFTESDIVSYLWMALYSGELDMGSSREDGKRIYLVHREYPTNFRYTKEDLGPEYKPGDTGGRGHYDLVVLNPEFVINSGVEHVVNKCFATTQGRASEDAPFKNEILVAMEFKYVINNSSAFSTQIHQDNHKLRIGKDFGIIDAINLVFCNQFLNKNPRESLINTIKEANRDVPTLLIESYYSDNGTKVTPRPEPDDAYSKILAWANKQSG